MLNGMRLFSFQYVCTALPSTFCRYRLRKCRQNQAISTIVLANGPCNDNAPGSANMHVSSSMLSPLGMSCSLHKKEEKNVHQERNNQFIPVPKAIQRYDSEPAAVAHTFGGRPDGSDCRSPCFQRFR
jgi:hypothetical protein